MNIGERIRSARERKGLSQEELAEIVGYSDKTAICKIEKGVRDIPRKKVDVFAAALGVSPAFLEGYENSEILQRMIQEEQRRPALVNLMSKLSPLDDSDLSRISDYVDFIRSQKGANL